MSTADLHRPFTDQISTSRHGLRSESRLIRQSAVSTIGWWTMLLASTVALKTSSYLAWASLTSSPVAGCSGGGTFDCSHVLHSRWSTVLSVPVSLPAIMTHLGVLSMLLWKPVSARLQAIRWSTLGLAACAAGAAAVWFINLQVFVLQHLCPYCMVAHTAGLILFAAFALSRPNVGLSMRTLCSGAAVSIAGLIGLQSLNSVPPSFEVIEYGKSDVTESSIMSAPASATGEAESFFEAPNRQADARIGQFEMAQFLTAIVNPASLLYGQVGVAGPDARTTQVLNGVQLRTDSWPMIGKKDAELVFVELFDYTCEHCQRTHKSLEAARDHFGDRLAIMTLPVPLDRKCNPSIKSTHPSHRESCELAKLAIAVWAVDADQFRRIS